MQVQLINLLRVAFFHCNFRAEGRLEECRQVLTSEEFTNCFVTGIQNPVSFVRMHHINFLVVLLPLLSSLSLSHAQQSAFILKLLDCFNSLLRKFDLSVYGEAEGFVDGPDPPSRMTTLPSEKATLLNICKAEEDEFSLNNESDVLKIVTGLKCVLFHYLNLQQQQEDRQNLYVDEDFNYMTKTMNSPTFSEKLRGLFSGSAAKGARHQYQPDTMQVVLGRTAQLIATTIHCWSDVDVFLARDYLFRRSGVCPYAEGDEILVNKMLGKGSEEAGIELGFLEDFFVPKLNRV